MRPVVTSLKGIDARAFTKVSGNIYKYQFEKDANGSYPAFRELYSNGRQLEMARGETFIHPFGMPNRKDRTDPANQKCLWVEEKMAKKIAKADSVFPAELVMFLEWEWCSARVGSIDLKDVRERDGKNTFP